VTDPGFENGGASGWGISGVNGFEVTTSAFHCGRAAGSARRGTTPPTGSGTADCSPCRVRTSSRCG
jgi:hypothetical protein